ncbi:MAG: ATP-binding protein, partial [Alphaproteobacteria bacterium]|nr:ATP-binding protein [Alphaproteobacteria bacterium]
EGVVYLLDAKGTVMTSSDRFIAAPEAGHGIPEAQRSPPEAATPDPALLQAVAGHRLTEFAAVGTDGVERLYSSANIQNGSLFIVFGMPAAKAISWGHYQTIAFIVGPIIMLLLAVAGALLGGELLISRGIRALQSAVDAYSRDELSVRVDVGRSALEIRQFAQAFAGMAERISLREGELRRSLDEKDALLREVHHRVKNNLQIVTSFLNLQAKSVADPAARHVLAEARMRVRALSIVHRYLYESADVRYVDFVSLVRTLGEQIARVDDLAARGIALEVTVEPVPIPGSAAVPVALFITEALSNAAQHAFPDGRTGTIRLSLTADGGDALLEIADDGIGMPGADPGQWPAGIGLSLMRAFARQLEGELKIDGPPATRVALRFPLRIDTETRTDEAE